MSEQNLNLLWMSFKVGIYLITLFPQEEAHFIKHVSVWLTAQGQQEHVIYPKALANCTQLILCQFRNRTLFLSDSTSDTEQH